MGEIKLTREEMETHIWGNAGSQDFEIYTADPKDIRRMDKLGYPVVEADEYGKRYKVPRTAVLFRRADRKKRILSEGQRGNIQKAMEARKSKHPVLSSGDQNAA